MACKRSLIFGDPAQMGSDAEVEKELTKLDAEEAEREKEETESAAAEAEARALSKRRLGKKAMRFDK
jgi:hypothetical protein